MTSSKELLKTSKMLYDGLETIHILKEKGVDIVDLIKSFVVDGKEIKYNTVRVNGLSKKEYALLKEVLA